MKIVLNYSTLQSAGGTMHFQELADKVGVSAAVEIRIIQNNVADIELPFEATCEVFDRLQGVDFAKAVVLLEHLRRRANTFRQWRIVFEREPTPAGRLFALERMIGLAGFFEEWCSVYHFAQIEEREDIISRLPREFFTREGGVSELEEDAVALQTWITLYDLSPEGTELKEKAFAKLSAYLHSYEHGISILTRCVPNGLSYQMAIGYLARCEPEDTASAPIQKTG